MKKAVLVTLLAILSVGAYCQNNIADNKAEHLTFCGIPIDGSASNFAKQLKQHGYTVDKKYFKKYDIYKLKGEFAGYKDCAIYLDNTSKNNTLYAIQVQLPNKDNWEDLHNNYIDLKEFVTKHYGKPIKVISDFNTEQVPRTDKDKYNALLEKRCIYGSMFETDYGLIIVYLDNPIDMEGKMHCHATVYFIDNLNYDFFNNEVHNIWDKKD